MKKMLIFLIVAMLLSSLAVAQTDVAGNKVGIKADAVMFLSPGFKNSSGFGVAIDIPMPEAFGLNIKKVNFETKDTTYTLNVFISGAAYKSKFAYDKENDMEAQRLSTYIRKTLGYKSMFIDVGVSVWNFVDIEFEDDKTYIGSIVAVGTKTYGFLLKAEGHYIPINDDDNIYAVGASFSYVF